MSRSIHLVFSEPPAGLSDDEYNSWYDAHVGEILATPGFLSARRFRLEPVVRNDGMTVFRYLALYEIEGDPAAAIAALERAGMGSKDTYTAAKEVDAGELELPGWFQAVAFASWNGIALGDVVEAAPAP